MALTLSQTGITQTQTINAWHVTQSIDAFTGAQAYDITISGSLVVTGSSTITGSLITIGPQTVSGSLIVSGSSTISGSIRVAGLSIISGSLILTGSLNLTGSLTTPPGTLAFTTPVNVYGANSTYMLGTPSGWISINIDGATYKLPLYN